MNLFRYVSDKNMKPMESVEAFWPMRELGQDRQSTLDVPVRIEVIHLWAGISKKRILRKGTLFDVPTFQRPREW